MQMNYVFVLFISVSGDFGFCHYGEQGTILPSFRLSGQVDDLKVSELEQNENLSDSSVHKKCIKPYIKTTAKSSSKGSTNKKVKGILTLKAVKNAKKHKALDVTEDPEVLEDDIINILKETGGTINSKNDILNIETSTICLDIAPKDLKTLDQTSGQELTTNVFNLDSQVYSPVQYSSPLDQENDQLSYASQFDPPTYPVKDLPVLPALDEQSYAYFDPPIYATNELPLLPTYGESSYASYPNQHAPPFTGFPSVPYGSNFNTPIHPFSFFPSLPSHGVPYSFDSDSPSYPVQDFPLSPSSDELPYTSQLHMSTYPVEDSSLPIYGGMPLTSQLDPSKYAVTGFPQFGELPYTPNFAFPIGLYPIKNQQFSAIGERPYIFPVAPPEFNLAPQTFEPLTPRFPYNIPSGLDAINDAYFPSERNNEGIDRQNVTPSSLPFTENIHTIPVQSGTIQNIPINSVYLHNSYSIPHPHIHPVCFSSCTPYVLPIVPHIPAVVSSPFAASSVAAFRGTETYSGQEMSVFGGEPKNREISNSMKSLENWRLISNNPTYLLNGNSNGKGNLRNINSHIIDLHLQKLVDKWLDVELDHTKFKVDQNRERSWEESEPKENPQSCDDNIGEPVKFSIPIILHDHETKQLDDNEMSTKSDTNIREQVLNSYSEARQTKNSKKLSSNIGKQSVLISKMDHQQKDNTDNNANGYVGRKTRKRQETLKQLL